jgi:hypothetical protein
MRQRRDVRRLIRAGRGRVDRSTLEVTVKISDLASPSLSAWIVAAATVGALALVPGQPTSDDARVARPPAADVSVNMPAMRGGASEGAVDMLPFAYDFDEWAVPGARPYPALVDAGT